MSDEIWRIPKSCGPFIDKKFEELSKRRDVTDIWQVRYQYIGRAIGHAVIAWQENDGDWWAQDNVTKPKRIPTPQTSFQIARFWESVCGRDSDNVGSAVTDLRLK